MYRLGIEKLKVWKNKKNRKPLIIRGARQVGKTWLMKYFADNEYDDYVYINFENNPQIQRLFDMDYDIQRIILGIEIFNDVNIRADKTLIIFDEIQECPRALTALKYFYENAPEYQIVCAGSLLGIAAPKVSSFPVGKVDFFDLYPLSFSEFLLANGEDKIVKLLEKMDFELLTLFKDKLIYLLKTYYYVGGMPEVVNEFIQHRDFKECRDLQKKILIAYEQDFSKHAPNKLVPKIRNLFKSVPSQLAKENKKFIYGLVREGARAKEYENAIMWLIDSGLIHQVHRVKKPFLPLSMYEDRKAFKLYLLDVGLLSCLANLDYKTILEKNDIFKEFKGALTEQYVLQELMVKKELDIYYWTSEKGTSELDFLLQIEDKVVPLEVKAEQNLKAKSLKVYKEKFKPEISLRTAMVDYKREDWIVNLPLWAVSTLPTFLSQ